MYKARRKPRIVAHFRWGRVFMYPASFADFKLALREYWRSRHITTAFRHVPWNRLSDMKAADAYYAALQCIEEKTKPPDMSESKWQVIVEGEMALIDVGDVKANVFDYLVNWLWSFWFVCLVVDILQAWIIGMPEAEYQPDYPLHI